MDEIFLMMLSYKITIILLQHLCICRDNVDPVISTTSSMIYVCI